MRGIHDGPDLTTWPDAKPDPKRGRALLIVVAVLSLACGVASLAGVHDGPDGVDPLGETTGTVFGDVVHVGPDNIYPNGGLNDMSMTCSREQEASCEKTCQDAARPGEISVGSKCEKRMQPTGISGIPGLVVWVCQCTWVKSPLIGQR